MWKLCLQLSFRLMMTKQVNHQIQLFQSLQHLGKNSGCQLKTCQPENHHGPNRVEWCASTHNIKCAFPLRTCDRRAFRTTVQRPAYSMEDSATRLQILTSGLKIIVRLSVHWFPLLLSLLARISWLLSPQADQLSRKDGEYPWVWSLGLYWWRLKTEV